MDMSRSVGVAVHHLNDLTCGPIVWNGIRSGSQAIKRVLSTGTGLELAPEIEVFLIGILLLVQSCRLLDTPFYGD